MDIESLVLLNSVKVELSFLITDGCDQFSLNLVEAQLQIHDNSENLGYWYLNDISGK